MIDIFDGNNCARIEWERTANPMQHLYSVAKLASPNLQIWVWDGFNGLERRRKVYPGYKVDREQAPDGFYAALGKLKEVFSCLSNVIQYTVPGYEADDVIATLVQGTKLPVRIHSTDGDFQQLACERVLTTRKPYEGVQSKHVRIYKATVGDPKDKIKGIRGFGDKAWAVCDPTLLDSIASGKTDPRLYFDRDLIPNKWLEWMELEGNLKLLRDMYEIVGFYTVPDDQLSAGRVIGQNDPARAESLIRGGLYVAPSLRS